MLQLASSLDAFAVEEIPLYEPCGSGDYLWLWVEKENLHTDTIIRFLAEHYKINPRQVGVAGRKDKLAVTRQYFSVPQNRTPTLPAVRDVDGGRWAVLHSKAHDYPLKLGQLKGNRFVLRLEQVDEEAVDACIAGVQDKPLLNLYGEQRFGHKRQNLLAVQALSAGKFKEAVDIICMDAGNGAR